MKKPIQFARELVRYHSLNFDTAHINASMNELEASIAEAVAKRDIEQHEAGIREAARVAGEFSMLWDNKYGQRTRIHEISMSADSAEEDPHSLFKAGIIDAIMGLLTDKKEAA